MAYVIGDACISCGSCAGQKEAADDGQKEMAADAKKKKGKGI